MDTLIFATNNQHKTDEIRSIPGIPFNVISLQEAGIHIDIPEPHNTLEENASEKSSVIYKLTQKDCFSEDTGLEVEALGGEPGVKSARYAGGSSGKQGTFERNIEKLLKKMEGQHNRNAQFRTVLSLILGGKEYTFEGICKGTILTCKKGEKGFGYDPVFVPQGSTKSFAEMDMEEKNNYSHRKKAVGKLLEFLKKVKDGKNKD